jgi:hypothetical protein
MKIRLKTDHSVTRDADPIEEARIGNGDPYGWSSIDRENQTQILYPITRWERAPIAIERWEPYLATILNNGRTIRLVVPGVERHTIGSILQFELPDNLRAIPHGSHCVIFERRVRL